MDRHAVRHSLPVSFTYTSLIVRTFVCPEPSHDGRFFGDRGCDAIAADCPGSTT
jgi:hypothetical protein